tara:strand:- start:1793 stop:2263 length:471 start_codon:yes stop_codon:yes gene_type:complete
MVDMVKHWQRIKDDRGSPIKLCMIWRATRASGFEKAFLVQRGDTVPFWSSFFLMGSMFAVAMQTWEIVGNLVAGRSAFPLSISWTIGIFVGQFVLFGGAMAGFMHLYMWRSDNHARNAMLRAGLCVSCAYRIDDIESETDGCTICPECGGAWRVHG